MPIRARGSASVLSAWLSVACSMLLGVLAFTASPSAAAAEVLDELRSSLFEDANAALAAANDARANLLSPTNYAEGAEYYRRAEETLNRGGNIESIRRDLDRAAKAFREAAEQAGLAATTFASVLSARADAESANAPAHATEAWQEAEELFNDATVTLERGRIERAQRAGVRAENQYREAELIAIKVNYLDETRRLLETAREVRAPRYAPRSYNQATERLAEAEERLETNRYDTDEPRNLASAAKHDALHAIYVAGLEARIRDDELMLEDVLLDWEASIRKVADVLDLPAHFDDGPDAVLEHIAAGIRQLQAENTELKARLADRETQLETLIQETASMERLSKLVARQERQKERLAKVEALFGENEAIVLRQQDSIILRLIGLNFDTGKAELKPEHEAILTKLEQAVNGFPESNIVIEGHTDAFGSDTDNLVLSQKRAEAVLNYLLQRTPVSPGNLTALGYGESRPVANNETEEGRRRNRRIDVVIYPKW